MTIQIRHEAEHHRQHARYRIPGNVIFEGKVYSLEEWSVSGFSVTDFAIEVPSNSTVTGEFVFVFIGFKFSIEVEFEKLRVLANGITACRFVNLTKEQLSVFHQIINAFLAGEVIQVGEMLSVMSREGMVTKDFSERLKPKRTFWQSVSFQLKRFTGFLIFSTIIVGLLSFVFSTAYERIFVIHSLSAQVVADSKLIRAPENGFFQISGTGESSSVKPGDLMGVIKLVAGGASSVESPCDCEILNNYVDEGLFVGKGEPIFRVLPDSSVLQIEAQIRFQDVKKIRTGHRASVLLTNGEKIPASVTQVLSMQTGTMMQNTVLNDAISGARAKVLLALDLPIDRTFLDSVAYVTIDTMLGQ